MCCSKERTVSLGVKSITSNVDVNTGVAATVHIERHLLVHNVTDFAHIDAFCSHWDTFCSSCVHIGTDPSHALCQTILFTLHWDTSCTYWDTLGQIGIKSAHIEIHSTHIWVHFVHIQMASVHIYMHSVQNGMNSTQNVPFTFSYNLTKNTFNVHI